MSVEANIIRICDFCGRREQHTGPMEGWAGMFIFPGGRQFDSCVNCTVELGIANLMDIAERKKKERSDRTDR